jgi:DNA-binding IclR family transcriptional regulator
LTRPGCITGDIVEALPIAQSTTSQHLKVLKEAGWIMGTIEGVATNYCLKPEALVWFKDIVQKLFPEEKT